MLDHLRAGAPLTPAPATAGPWLAQPAGATTRDRPILQSQPSALYQRFSMGDPWSAGWATEDWTHWQASSGGVTHHAASADTLTYTSGTAPLAAFGIQVRAVPQAPMQAALGFVVGEDLRITWSPHTAAWQWTAGAQSQTAIPRFHTILDYAIYAPMLDVGHVPPDLPAIFAQAGLPVVAGSQVTVLTPATAWQISAASGTAVYYLVRPNATASCIGIATVPRRWTLLADGDTLVLFAEGSRVFSWRTTAPLTGPLGITVSDHVTFTNLILFTNPQVAATDL